MWINSYDTHSCTKILTTTKDNEYNPRRNEQSRGKVRNFLCLSFANTTQTPNFLYFSSRLTLALQNKNFYEGHQLIRSLYFRKKQQKKYDELITLLSDGANKFLDFEQRPIAADLGILLIDTLECVPHIDGTLWITNIGNIIRRIGAEVIERESLMMNLVKWVSARSDGNSLKGTLHQTLARILWNEGNMEMAKHHFLLSGGGGTELAKMLIQLSTRGYVREIDLIIVQTVLQQLCLKQKEVAAETFGAYTKCHPKIGKFPFDLPLLNFTYFLLKVIDSGKLESFEMLVRLYKPSIDRDAVYEKYLQKIAVIWLNAAAPRTTNNGIFGDLINQLFNGLEDQEDQFSDNAEDLD